MNHVALKLEAALAAYVAANFQGSGEPLHGVPLEYGHTAEVQVPNAVGFFAGSTSGPHARQGCYEVPVQFIVLTSMEKEDGTETEASLRLRHGERVEALQGIFGDSLAATVAAALVALDAELIVSGYWLEGTTDDFTETSCRTTVTKVFSAGLA